MFSSRSHASAFIIGSSEEHSTPSGCWKAIASQPAMTVRSAMFIAARAAGSPKLRSSGMFIATALGVCEAADGVGDNCGTAQVVGGTRLGHADDGAFCHPAKLVIVVRHGAIGQR